MHIIKDESIRPEHTGAFLRLKKLINHAQGFRLLIIDYNIASYRDFIIQRLNSKEYQTCVIDTLEQSGFSELEKQLFAIHSNKTVTHIINLELQLDPTDIYTGFNYHRERIAQGHPHTLVIWLSQSSIKEFSNHAIDFWAWREQVFDFFVKPSLNPNTDNLLSVNLEQIQHTNLEQKASRKQEIFNYLSINPDISQKLYIELYQELAQIDMLLGLYDSGLNYLQRAKDLTQETDDQFSYYLLLRDEARIFYLQGKYEEAFYLLSDKILPAFEQFDAMHEALRTQRQLVDIKTHYNQYDAALAILEDKLLAVYRRLSDTRSVAQTQSKIADILMHQNKYSQALELLQQYVLPVYQELNEIRLIAIAQGQIAEILMLLGQYDRAIEIQQYQVLPIYQQLGEVRTIAITQGRIADILMIRGQYLQALDIRQHKELPVYKRLGDIREIAVVQGKIADILTVENKYDDALELIQKEALPIFIQLGEISNIAITQGRIAGIFSLKGEYKKSFDILQQQLPIYKQLQDDRLLAYTQGQIADLLIRLGKYNEALDIRQKQELPTYERIGAIRDIAITKGQIAQIYFLSKRYDNAIHIYETQVIPLLEKLGDLATLTNIKINLIFAYRQRNPKRSLKKIEALLRWCYETATRLQLSEIHTIEKLIHDLNIEY